jgi:hypothetical protein
VRRCRLLHGRRRVDKLCGSRCLRESWDWVLVGVTGVMGARRREMGGERYFAPVTRATLPASEGMEGSNGHFCFESGEIE